MQKLVTIPKTNFKQNKQQSYNTQRNESNPANNKHQNNYTTQPKV